MQNHEQRPERVALSACGSYAEADVTGALEALLDSLGSLSRFVAPGARVLIKPNWMYARTPESACITHPALVAALSDAVEACGGVPVVGDSPGGPFFASHVRFVAEVCGYAALAREGRLTLNHDFSYRPVSLPDGVGVKEINIITAALDADVIINVAKLKTHAFTGMSAAVKNLFGLVPGLYKAEYHWKLPDLRCFAEMLVDIAERCRPVLSIVDAVEAMEGNGPGSGTPRHMGLLLGGASPYAVDDVCARLIGLPTQENVVRAAAAARALLPLYTVEGGTIEAFAAADFRRQPPRDACDALAAAPGGMSLLGRMGQKLFASRPVIRYNTCVGCGECIRVCPAKVVTIREKKAHIDTGGCIRCFCCQEFCPAQAIVVKSGPAARILRRRNRR